MSTEARPNPPRFPSSTVLTIVVALLLLIGFWIFAASVLFVGKKMVDPYLAPPGAGSTTGFGDPFGNPP